MERDDYTSFGVEIVTAGNAIYSYAGRRQIVNAGSAFLKLPGKGHRYETGPAGFLHKRFINMDGAGLRSMVTLTGLEARPVIEIADSRWFVDRQREIAEIIARRPPRFPILLSSIVYQVLIECAIHSGDSRWPVGLREAVEYMQANVRLMPGSDAVAEAANVGRSHLNRIFNEKFGMSPQRYFREIKMRIARDMLQHSSLAIKNIAFDLGYSDPFAFTTQFRKIVGVPPKTYREQTPPEYEEAEKRT